MKKRAKQKADSPPAEKKRSFCCHWGNSNDSDSDSDNDSNDHEGSPTKKKSKKASSARKEGQSQQFQSVQMTRKTSMRSSIDEDEFADARDDLELKL